MFLFAILSFCIAALSGMGVGGGGLFVIFLALLTETPQLVAQGMNLLFFLFSAGASLTVHLVRRSICFPAVLLMATAGVVGALIGTGMTGLFAEDVLRKCFGFLLIMGGILSLRKRKEPSEADGTENRPTEK